MAPRTLMQMSLTIKFYPFIHPPPILSPHQYLDFIFFYHRHNAILLLHSGGTHATSPPFMCTFAYSALMHTPSQHLCWSTWVMHVLHHHRLCATFPPTIPRSHTPTFISTFAMFIHPCSHAHRPVSFFIYPLWCSCAGSHTLIRMSGMGSHSARNVILPLFQEFSHNVLQSRSQCMADITVRIRLNMKPHCLFSLSSLSRRREGWVKDFYVDV